MREEITKAQFPMPPNISPQCQDLLRGILEPNPTQRFATDSILVHPWLFGLGNVFPSQKVTFKLSEKHLALNSGNFSASDVRRLPLSDKRPPAPTLGTIMEEGQREVAESRPQLRDKPVQPRSISLNARAPDTESG
jgi:serine/threonine protein kinase